MSAPSADTHLSTPLSQRVTAPNIVHNPEHPDVALWRHATIADLDEIATLHRAIDQHDHPEWLTPREDIARDLEAEHIDIVHDTLLAFCADGTAIAYGLVAEAPGDGERVQVYLLGGVHPEWRAQGVGRELMRWQHDRARQRLAASEAHLPGWITTYCEEANRSAISVALRLGMNVARYFITMQRDLAAELPPIATPAPVRVVPFESRLSMATLDARNDSFRDHWGNQPKSEENWNHWVEGDVFRADLSFLALIDERDEKGNDASRVVGFSLADVNPESAQTGDRASVLIARVGVVRSHRGQKIAPAMIAATLHASADAGYTRAVLEVDADSPTGANSLYERLGFTAVDRLLALVHVF